VRGVCSQRKTEVGPCVSPRRKSGREVCRVSPVSRGDPAPKVPCDAPRWTPTRQLLILSESKSARPCTSRSRRRCRGCQGWRCSPCLCRPSASGRTRTARITCTQVRVPFTAGVERVSGAKTTVPLQTESRSPVPVGCGRSASLPRSTARTLSRARTGPASGWPTGTRPRPGGASGGTGSPGGYFERRRGLGVIQRLFSVRRHWWIGDCRDRGLGRGLAYFRADVACPSDGAGGLWVSAATEEALPGAAVSRADAFSIPILHLGTPDEDPPTG
jgi:hypothetical protein